MRELPAQWLPKLSKKHVDELRAAYARIDQIGQVLGTTNLQAKPLLLGELSAVAQAIAMILDVVDRRAFNFRQRYHLLTDEDRAYLASQAKPPSDKDVGAEGDS